MIETPHSSALALLYKDLEILEQTLATGDPNAAAEWEPRLKAHEQKWAETMKCSKEDRNSALLALATARGHVERVTGSLLSAAEAYSSALSLLDKVHLEPFVRDRRASGLHMYLGLSRLSANSPGEWSGALGHFDECIRILQTAKEPDLATRWSLSAAWLNRGDALRRIGDPDGLKEAIHCNQQAIQILQEFPLEGNPAFRTRLALAWMNCGEIQVMQSRHGGKDLEKGAFHSYEEALRAFEEVKITGGSAEERFLAVILTNLSRARLVMQSENIPSAEAESRRALSLIKEQESHSPEMTNLGLTARITLCHSLEKAGGSDGDIEITDIAEQGLSRAAEVRASPGGSEVSEPLIGELFRCGAGAYYRSSPQFLSEYLLEHLDPAVCGNCFADLAICQEVAVETLWKGIAQIQQNGFTGMDTEAYEVRRGLLVEWQQLRERLLQIRREYFEI